jgi:hypothetical protein
MDKQNRKELLTEYKTRKVTGGIYSIKNTVTGKFLLLNTVNLQGSKNRFDFSQKMGGCENLKLAADWKEYGSGAFILEVLEEIDKGDSQTQEEFKDDIKLLYSMWLEKIDPVNLY